MNIQNHHNMKCDCCGNSFYIKYSHMHLRKHCSKECYLKNRDLTGNKNPNWRGGKKTQLKTFNLTCNICNNLFTCTIKKQKTCSKACKIKLFSAIRKGRQRVSKIKKPSIHEVCLCGRMRFSKERFTVCLKCRWDEKREYINCLVCNNKFHKRTTKSTFCSISCRASYKEVHEKGSNNPNWKGGVKPKNQIERMSKKYKTWRSSVYIRDNYTCVDCGQIGGKLHAHHIKAFSTHKELRFDVSNGKTVCIPCHNKYHPKLKLSQNLGIKPQK